MSTWVWVKGDVVPSERARVAATDRGLLLGEGVFETVALVDATPFALRRHLERLRASAVVAGFSVPWTDDDLRGAVAETISTAVADDASLANGRLRITVTGGDAPAGPAPAGSPPVVARPELLVMVTGRAPRSSSVDVVVAPWPVNERGPLVGAKVTSRLDHTLAQAHAHRQGADEAMLVNTRDVLVEGTSSNVFLVVAGRLSTPSLDTGCLPGVTRALLTELVEVAERHDLTTDDLRLATEAFITSTTRGVQPIAAVEGRQLRSVPGPLTTEAAAALEGLRRRDLDP